MSSYTPAVPLSVPGGTGVVGIAETYESWVEDLGNGIKRTNIFIDLTGLRSTAGDDIIGDDGTSNPCHIGQINFSECGTPIAGSVTCLEAPAGGDPDINVYSAVEATGAEDGAIADLDETQLINAGDHTNGRTLGFTALPADGEYLYLVAGDTTNADYTAGKLLIQFIGNDG